MKVNVTWHSFQQEYFLFLLPLFFVLHGYTYYFPLVPLMGGVKLLAIYISVFTVLYFLLLSLFRQRSSTSMYLFCLMSFFFFFGAAHDAVKYLMGSSFLATYSFILPLSFFLLTGLALFFKRTKRSFNRFTQYINYLFTLLILIDVFTLIYKVAAVERNSNNLHSDNYKRCPTCATPDIYLIVADEYAGTKELKDILHFDNTPFLNELQKRDFHIISNSKSNYNYTPYSVASMLSMNYLNGITDRSNDPQNRNRSYRHINDNELVRFLKTYNYQFINYSVFDFAGQPTRLNSLFFLTREHLITGQTFFGRIDRDLRYLLISRFHLTSEIGRQTYGVQQNNETVYTRTIEAAKQKEVYPRFIYTHLMMPHYPYFFNKEGKAQPLNMIKEGNQNRQDMYLDYLLYCNKKFLYLIDEIKKNAATPPLILFMSDHGFRNFSIPVAAKYHFMNINAVYLQGKRPEGFYDGMSNVNEFRILLNIQFGRQFPILKDSTVFLQEY